MSLSIIAGPLIGAVIGYITNYLAVKMLFHPREEIRIGGFRLPFTPGVIPKGKARLARAAGRAVGSTMLTKEDMNKHLLSEETQDMVADKVMKLLSEDVKQEITTITGIDEEAYFRKKGKFANALSNRIFEAVSEIDIKGKVVEAAEGEIKAKIKELESESMMGSMIAMMLPEERIISLVEPVGARIELYVNENGMSYIVPAVNSKVDELEKATGLELLNALDISDERMRRAVRDAYCRVVEDNLGKVFGYIDIAGLIEDKINDMAVSEVEELVLSVMNKELDMIVRLGAVIGFLIGIINVFI